MYDNIKITTDKKKATIKTRDALVIYVHSLKKKTAKTTNVTVLNTCFYTNDAHAELKEIEEMNMRFLRNKLHKETDLETSNNVLKNFIENKYNTNISFCDKYTQESIDLCLIEIADSLAFCQKFNYNIKTDIEISNNNRLENFDITDNKVCLNINTKSHIVVHEIMHAFLYKNSLEKFCLISEIMGMSNSNKIEKFLYSLDDSFSHSPYSQEMRMIEELKKEINTIVTAATSRVAVTNTDANEVFCNIASFIYYFTNRKNMQRPSDLFYVRKESSDVINNKINRLQSDINDINKFADETVQIVYKRDKRVLIVEKQAKIIQLKNELERDVNLVIDEGAFLQAVAEPFCKVINFINENSLTLKKHYVSVNKKNGGIETKDLFNIKKGDF